MAEEAANAAREDRRARILDAARAAFSQRGLDGASLRGIAADAGCTTGAIYSQFPGGRPELYAAVLAGSLERLHAAVSGAVARADGPVAGVRAGVDAYAAHYRAHPSEVALGLYLFGGARPAGVGKGRDAELNAQLRASLDVLADAVADLAPEVDAELEVATLFSHLMGVLIVEQTGRSRVTRRPTDEVLDHVRETLVARLVAAGAGERRHDGRGWMTPDVP